MLRKENNAVGTALFYELPLTLLLVQTIHTQSKRRVFKAVLGF